MTPKSFKQVIPAAIFFMGLAFVFYIGVGRVPGGNSMNTANQTQTHTAAPPVLAHLEKHVAPPADPVPAPVEMHHAEAAVTEKVVQTEGVGDGNDAVEEAEEEAEEGEVERAISSEPPKVEAKAPAAKVEPAKVESKVEKKVETKVEGAVPMAVPGVQPVALKDDGICKSVEIRGDGLKKTNMSQDDWVKVVGQFHHSKELLLDWLKTNEKFIPKAAYVVLEAQIHDLKIVQPSPTSNQEPDLSWRGIGVWIRDERNAPLILVGNGFIDLLKVTPKRSAFEMTRLVAQSWGNCELRRLGVDPIWSPLLNCLGEMEDPTCLTSKASEDIWAVSSSLATLLENPGCELPVFRDAQKKACLWDMFKNVGERAVAVAAPPVVTHTPLSLATPLPLPHTTPTPSMRPTAGPSAKPELEKSKK